MMQVRTEARRRPETLESKLSKALDLPINKGDLLLLGFIITGLAFIGIRNPATMTVYLVACLVAHSVKMMVDYFPRLGKIFGFKVRAHHVAGLILICTMIFSSIGMPANALIFQTIEDKVVEIIGASGGGIDTATIALIFTVLRIIVIFGILVGGIFLVNQAMQGGDWKPIGNMMAIGVSFVLAIEVLSQLVLA